MGKGSILYRWRAHAVLLLLLFTPPSFAQLLKYNITGSYSWYPYFIANQPEAPGMVSELIPLILSLANIEGENLSLPPKRTNNALETGQ